MSLAPFWVDFHTHILDAPSIAPAAEASRAAHVKKWLVNSVDIPNWEAHTQKAREYPEALVGVGWHPEQVIEVPTSQIQPTLQKLEGMVSHAPYLGETGLDFLYGKTDAQRLNQKIVFEHFIEWSNREKKLLEIHSRHAKQEVIDLLLEKNAKHVLLHWFNGNKNQTQTLIENKWVATVGPTILNSPHIDKFIQQMPLELIGLETDSPIPFSGIASDPSWIVRVASRVAELKGVSLEEVQQAQTQIFERFFPTHL